MSYPWNRIHPELDLACLLAVTALDRSLLAEMAGISLRTLDGDRVTRGLTPATADRLAAAAGHHPADVWPAWWDLAGVPCPRCGRLFVPVRSSHRACREACAAALRWKHRYHTDPDYRAARIAATRRYYDQCGDYERAQARRRWRENRAA